MALTDHDEVEGNISAADAAEHYQIRFVPGVELSIEYELTGKGHLHLLGLFLDPLNQDLRSALNILRQARAERAGEIVERLGKINIRLSIDEIRRDAGRGSIGRPHIAKYLVKNGYAGSMIDAFRKYLGKGCPGYVPKKKLPLGEAVGLIHNAAGITILAHPVSLGIERYDRLAEKILELTKFGLDGIEVYYSSHDRNMTDFLLEFARKHQLLISGGSDFHGATKPDTNIGTGRGDLVVPDRVYAELIEQRHHRNDF